MMRTYPTILIYFFDHLSESRVNLYPMQKFPNKAICDLCICIESLRAEWKTNEIVP